MTEDKVLATLVPPTPDLHVAWLGAHAEWGPGLHEDLRHRLDERTGHIGYGIRPSAREQGLATWALACLVDEARTRTMDRLLVVCAADNTACMGTIERNGGRLEEIRLTTNGPTRRYWIDLSGDS